MLLANFNLANTCAPHATSLHTIVRTITRVVLARVFGGINLGGINLGDLVTNLPICQIKIPAKVSGYTVLTTYNWILDMDNLLVG